MKKQTQKQKELLERKIKQEQNMQERGDQEMRLVYVMIATTVFAAVFVWFLFGR